MQDDSYSWNEVLHCVRAFWAVRERGAGDSMSQVRMLDIARAWSALSVEDKRSLFLGVWLERQEIPTAVIARMRHYLNGET